MSEEKTLGQRVEENLMAARGVSRRGVLKGGAALGLAGILAACSGDDDEGTGETLDPADVPEDSPLRGTVGDEMQGKNIEMGIAALAGWPPSQIPIDLYPEFSAYTQENFGYTTTVTKTEAPFAELFQKIAPSLAAGSQEYNIMVSDSQWLGALVEPGWIVSADDIMALNPELDIPVYSSLVVNTYQVYPDGSGQRWGFPQMPDTQGIFMRKDWVRRAHKFARNYCDGDMLRMTRCLKRVHNCKHWEDLQREYVNVDYTELIEGMYSD